MNKAIALNKKPIPALTDVAILCRRCADLDATLLEILWTYVSDNKPWPPSVRESFANGVTQLRGGIAELQYAAKLMQDEPDPLTGE